MHNLQLTEDQDLIVDTVRKYVGDVVAPKALEHDEQRAFVRTEFDGLAELGLFGLLVAEANGGAGMGFVPYAASLDAIGMHSASLARLWIGQTQSVLSLESAGAGALDEVAAGAVLASFVGPEHRLQLSQQGVSGTAAMVSGAAQAQSFVVAASRDGEAVLASVAPEATERTALRCLGLASAGCASVRFDAAPATVLASGEAAAAAIARAQLAGWIGVGALAIGSGAASIAAAKRHAGERIAFGKPLLKQEAVARKLVECRRQVEAARHLVYHAARLADLGEPAVEAALHARLAAVDAMVAAADESIQIHGGYGYTVEYHVERHYRDGKTLDVLDGGGEELRQRLAQLQFV
ncbi:MAG TPA: acyl-CoA dehydrogenase family protein [Planctomycetota bacterium]|nr:acyl-CoA dehydrogenase family protein [Planctomycetota bacterium]